MISSGRPGDLVELAFGERALVIGRPGRDFFAPFFDEVWVLITQGDSAKLRRTIRGNMSEIVDVREVEQ